MKPLALVFILFVVCFGAKAQQKSITFINKEDAKQKWTNALPVETYVLYENKKGDYVVVIGYSDSTLICKQNIYVKHPDTVIQQRYIPYAQRNIENMLNPGFQTDQQIRNKYFETDFKDTMIIKWSDVEEITVISYSDTVQKRPVAPKIIVGISALAILIGAHYLPDSNGVSEIKPAASWSMILGGFAGAMICIRLLNPPNKKVILTRKWRIETKQ